MLNQNKEEYKKLISLRRLAKEVPYKVTYLSLLVQRGKLKAEKIGRNYFTTREWFEEYLEMHARDEKIERWEEVRAENQESKKTKKQENNQSAYFDAGDIKKDKEEEKERGQELDLSVLENITRMTRINANDANDANTFITGRGNKVLKNFFSFLNNSAKKSKKLISNSWRKKLAAISYLGLVAVFCFVSLAPSASASFVEMLDKTISAPIEAGRAMVKASAEVATKASRLIAQSSVGQIGRSQVAGISEENNENPIFHKVSSLIDKTTEKSKETWQAVKGGVSDVFSDLAQTQRDLSVKLNNKVARLTEASVGRVKGVSESGGIKLAQLTDKVGETGEEVKVYAQTSKLSFLKEFSRSAQSLVNLYTKVVDLIIPDSLKKYSGQEEKVVETPAEEGKEKAITEITEITEKITPASKTTTPN